MNQPRFDPEAHHHYRASQPNADGTELYHGTWLDSDLDHLIRFAKRYQRRADIVITIWQSTLDSEPGQLPLLWESNPAEFLIFIGESDEPSQAKLI